MWDVIARSRATDNGGTDWPALAAHLHVPLPYLLYRAQTRYEEDLRGLQGIRTALSPADLDPAAASPSPDHLTARPTPVSRLAGQSTSTRLTTPPGLRARLNSLTPAPPNIAPKVSSSSIITLQHGPRLPRRPPVRSHSSSPGSGDDSEAELNASEEAERQQEERETLDQKLRNLQTMITGDKLGLVRSSRPRQRTERPSRDPQRALSNYTSLDSSSPSTSSVGSPQGSIPSIPSPPPERHWVQQPMPRHAVPIKSSSPPTLSPRHARPQGFGGLIGVTPQNSERDSNNGSSASSFSDLSGQCFTLVIFLPPNPAPLQMLVSPLPPWIANLLPVLPQAHRDCSSIPSPLWNFLRSLMSLFPGPHWLVTASDVDPGLSGTSHSSLPLYLLHTLHIRFRVSTIRVPVIYPHILHRQPVFLPIFSPQWLRASQM